MKISGVNFNNLRYTDGDTVAKIESEKELNSGLMRMNEASRNVAENSIFKSSTAECLVPSYLGK